MKYPQYKASLKKGKPKHLYVLTGKENFLKQEALSLLKSHLGKENLFFKEYDSENFNLDSFVSDIYCSPLFEEWNLIIVKSAGNLAASLHDPLAKFLNAPPPESIVVLEMDKLDQRTRLAKLVKNYSVECNALKGKNIHSSARELNAWILNRASYYQKKIHPNAINFLVKLTGSDLNELDLQLQKLSLFIQGREFIEENDICDLVEDSQRTDIFDLMDAIFMRQTKIALQLLFQLFKKGSLSQDGQVVINASHISLQCVRLIHYRLRQLWKYSLGRDDIPPFIRRKLAMQAPLFSSRALGSIWKKLVEIEFALKTSRLTPRLAVEQLVLFINSLRKNP